MGRYLATKLAQLRTANISKNFSVVWVYIRDFSENPDICKLIYTRVFSKQKKIVGISSSVCDPPVYEKGK